MNIKSRDVGIFPLMLSLPFMFFPKLIDGDTQPWVLVAALIALLTFRTDKFINKRDTVLIILPFLCILVYAFRSAYGFEFLRHVYTYLAFLIFWVVSQREKGDYFPVAIKATVVVWFLVGIYQFLAIYLGYQIDIPGRYMEGRMGVPSLTAEASYYGSFSVIQIMYLLSDKKKRNGFFLMCAGASVILSGSLLAMILLVFPLMMFPAKYRFGMVVILLVIVAGSFYFEMLPRLGDIFSEGVNVNGIFQDMSLNLRAGHIYFTLYENFIPSLFFGSLDFLAGYNNFASKSGLFVATGSNYILPAIGEMIYGSGIFGLLLLIVFLNRAQDTCLTKKEKIIKVGFIVTCMLNPISLSNIFLIIYATRRG